MPCFAQVARQQALGQVRILVPGDHPAHDVAAEEVEDHIERVVEIRNRALELGDIPGPDLIRARRDQLGGGIGRMPGLCAPLAHFVGRGEHAIHRARGAEVGLLVEQRGMNLGGRLVDEPRAVQHVEDRLAFGGTQRPAARAAAVDRALPATPRRCDTAPPSHLAWRWS